MQVRIVEHAFDIVHLLTDQNPIQVLVDAIINRWAGSRRTAGRQAAAGAWKGGGGRRLTSQKADGSCGKWGPGGSAVRQAVGVKRAGMLHKAAASSSSSRWGSGAADGQQHWQAGRAMAGGQQQQQQ
jgi:hypothetical protein